MNEKQKLNEEDLLKISGGLIDDESADWINRNSEIILKRASANNLKYEQRSLIEDMISDDELYSLVTLKKKLKELGIDCDDLV